MPIYNLNEGLFNIFKSKKPQPSKEEIELEDKIEKHVTNIIDKHKNRYKDIIAKIFAKCPKGFKALHFHDMIPDMSIYAGHIFAIDFSEIEDDEVAESASMLMDECVHKLNDYNKRNGISYIKVYVHDDYVGYDINRDDVVKIINSNDIKQESSIFSNINFI